MESNKIKAWGVKQALWGSIYSQYYWFASKEERDKYVAEHDHLDKLRCRMIEKYGVFQTYEAFKKWYNDLW